MSQIRCKNCGRDDFVEEADLLKYGPLCRCCIAALLVKKAKTKNELDSIPQATRNYAEASRLDKRFAYKHQNGGTPIFCPDQMIPEKPIVCKPLNKEWQQRISEDCWWATGYMGTDDGGEAERDIIKTLLSFGGYEACMPVIEDDAHDILYRGQLWYGDKTDLVIGRPSQCHSNSCELWELNRKNHEVAIATGYALSADGLWRQHSWLMKRNTRSVRVIETTVKRVAYFGFVMTTAEAERFCFHNP